MLAKLIAVAVLVWFYKSAQQAGENPIQWSIFGVIGFFLIATLAHFVISEPLLGTLPPKSNIAIIVSQLPIFIGIAAVYFIKRKHLVKK